MDVATHVPNRRIEFYIDFYTILEDENTILISSRKGNFKFASDKKLGIEYLLESFATRSNLKYHFYVLTMNK